MHNPANRRIRTRTYGGVGGEELRGSPLSRFVFGSKRNRNDAWPGGLIFNQGSLEDKSTGGQCQRLASPAFSAALDHSESCSRRSHDEYR